SFGGGGKKRKPPIILLCTALVAAPLRDFAGGRSPGQGRRLRIPAAVGNCRSAQHDGAAPGRKRAAIMARVGQAAAGRASGEVSPPGSHHLVRADDGGRRSA